MAKENVTPKARKLTTRELAERMRLELVGIKAAVCTVQQVLTTRGALDQDMSTLLIRCAVVPLESVLAELKVVTHG